MIAVMAGVPACDVACGEVGCNGELEIVARDAAGNPVSGIRGTVVVDGQQFDVNCIAGADASGDVACGQSGATLRLTEDLGGGGVSVDLSADGGVRVSDVVDANWDSGYPNGKDCPACWFGELEIVFE